MPVLGRYGQTVYGMYGTNLEDASTVTILACLLGVVMFQNYLRSSPSTVVIDPLEAINKLLDRHEQYRHVAECSVVEEGNHYVLLLLRIYRISLNTTRVSN